MTKTAGWLEAKSQKQREKINEQKILFYERSIRNSKKTIEECESQILHDKKKLEEIKHG